MNNKKRNGFSQNEAEILEKLIESRGWEVFKKIMDQNIEGLKDKMILALNESREEEAKKYAIQVQTLKDLINSPMQVINSSLLWVELEKQGKGAELWGFGLYNSEEKLWG